MTSRVRQEALQITVSDKQSLKEARAREDDWTGKTSAKERRKAQNRLHQRAWRRRRAADHAKTVHHVFEQATQTPAHDFLSSAFAAAAASLVSDENDKPRPQIETAPSCQALACPPTRTTPLPSSTHHQPLPSDIHALMRQNLVAAHPLVSTSNSKPTRLIAPILSYVDTSARTHYIHPPHGPTFPLAPDHHLITLIQYVSSSRSSPLSSQSMYLKIFHTTSHTCEHQLQPRLTLLKRYNVLRAMITNFHLCNIIHTMPTECRIALTLSLLHHPPATAPPTFTPTLTQRLTPHKSWIDSVPCPALRDNLILAATALDGNAFDEDDFCTDTCGGLYEGLDECASKGLLVWGDPWVVANWEVSPGFAEKWGFLLRGCGEMVEATNRWRETRGEEPLVVEVE